jgi:uncharacterized protein (DUF849 family)
VPTVLIKACLNGGRQPADHPAVPTSPDDIATDARRVAEAGAGAVHVHPRDPHGEESLDPAVCGVVVRAVRRAAPGLPIGLTTAAWVAPHPERLRLIERWDPAPDFASVNMREEGTVDLCRLLGERGIGAEAGVETTEDVDRLTAIETPWLRVLIEIDQEEDGRRAVEEATAVEVALDRAGIGAPSLHHAYERATWDVIRAAVDRGRDVRIGLEDTLVLPDGSPAPDNASLVAAAVDLARGVW